MYDVETREKVLSKDPKMDLAATVLVIEARETGRKSAVDKKGHGKLSIRDIREKSCPAWDK